MVAEALTVKMVNVGEVPHGETVFSSSEEMAAKGSLMVKLDDTSTGYDFDPRRPLAVGGVSPNTVRGETSSEEETLMERRRRHFFNAGQDCRRRSFYGWSGGERRRRNFND